MQTRNIAIALGAVLLVVLLLAVLAGASMLWMMGGSMMGGFMGGAGCCGARPFGGMVLLIVGGLFTVGLVALIIWLARQGSPQGAGTVRALDILRERYARGEISQEKYDQMKTNL